MPADTAASLTRILARHTATVSQCWFAVWNGQVLHPAFASMPTFELPGREYHLARGPVDAAVQSVGADLIPEMHSSCNLWWPEDHAWCVATDIDLDSTYVGASEACIDDLTSCPELEGVPSDLAVGIDADSDILNKPIE